MPPAAVRPRRAGMRDLDMLEAAADSLRGERRAFAIGDVGGGRRECSRMEGEELHGLGEGRAAGVKWASVGDGMNGGVDGWYG